MIELTYTITLKSPLRLATGVGQAGYLDNTIHRNGSGQPIVPGSSIKGKTRATAYRLANALQVASLHSADQEPSGCLQDRDTPCLICQIFGASQWPSKLYFEDASLPAKLNKLLQELDEISEKKNRPMASQNFGRHVRTSVAIDRRKRVALRQHLFTHEAVAQPASFIGRIYGTIRNMSDSYDELALLVVSMEAITHLGGAKGRGLGRCILTVTDIKANDETVPRDNFANALRRLGETL